MKQIAIITATRAEYGLFKPIILAIEKEPELECQLIVTGTHLSSEFGRTIAEIEASGINIHARLDVLNEVHWQVDGRTGKRF
jgi:GDP/UDP-N,N'-diacetylbacillosamine 2-epimerase (hydrolysing)